MLRTCRYCGLFSMHGEYCAGCGKHLGSRPLITRKQLFGLALALTLFGVLLGFFVSASGIFKEHTDLQLTLNTAVANCTGSYSYELLLHGKEPLDNAEVQLSIDDSPLERLRTDQNGRLSSTHAYPSTWCGEAHALTAYYKGNAFHAPASATQSLAVRIPSSMQLQAHRAGRSTVYTITLYDSERTPLAGEVVRLSSDSRELYGMTNTYGQSFFTVQLSEGEEMEGAFVGDNSYGPSGARAVASAADIVSLLQQHVVNVAHINASGAGVVIRHTEGTTLVLTNRHVIEGAQSVVVRTEDEAVPVTKVYIAPDGLDFAVLVLNGSYGTPVTLAPDSAYRRGTPVYAVGSPLGLRGTVSSGIISNVIDDRTGNRTVTVIQTDAPINPGNSGGGLFTADGELLGITTAKIISAEGIGFAIDVRTLSLLPSLTQWETRTLS